MTFDSLILLCLYYVEQVIISAKSVMASQFINVDRKGLYSRSIIPVTVSNSPAHLEIIVCRKMAH